MSDKNDKGRWCGNASDTFLDDWRSTDYFSYVTQFMNSTVSGCYGVAIGTNITIDHRNCIVIGSDIKTTRDFQLIIGNSKVTTSKDMTPDEFEELKNLLSQTAGLSNKIAPEAGQTWSCREGVEINIKDVKDGFVYLTHPSLDTPEVIGIKEFLSLYKLVKELK